MPQPQQNGLSKLTVRGGDEATELNVLDGRLRSVMRGRGSLVVELPPGAYKVIGHSGDAKHEAVILLQDKPKTIDVPLLEYSSPALLQGTSTFDRRQAEGAATRGCRSSSARRRQFPLHLCPGPNPAR